MNLATGRRLVVLNTSRSWGGNEHWAIQVAAGLQASGARVLFLYTHEVIGERARTSGVPAQPVRLRADLDLPNILALRRLLVNHRAEVVVPTRWREYLHAGLASRLAGRPRVVLRLGLDGTPRRDLKRRLVFGLADRVLVNAPSIRHTLAATGWIDPRKLVVVLNGLDLAAWRPRWEPGPTAQGLALRSELGVAPDIPLLLAVNAFSPQKDLGNLLEAMAEVHRHRPDARLLLLGDGEARVSLEERRQSLGLDDVVLMPGFRRDVSRAMAAADLLVLASRNEGMARVLIEAAASGLPAVATDVSGTRLAVGDGVNGRVVAPADPSAMAAAVLALLAPGVDRSALGRAARGVAERRFGEERMLTEAAQVFFG